VTRDLTLPVVYQLVCSFVEFNFRMFGVLLTWGFFQIIFTQLLNIVRT